MARNRMLNPEFWLDEQLAKLSPHARLLYQGLWGICDDNYATFPNRPEWIKAQVFPYEEVSIQELLSELSESSHIVLFSENDKEYWYLKNFFKHQKVEKPSKSKYPKFEPNLVVVGEELENTLSEEKISKVKIREENIATQGVAGEVVEIEVIGGEVNGLISLFKEINPNYDRLYENKTQREALIRQVKRFSYEKLERLIKDLPRIMSLPYSPQITTPLQLENKMGDLIQFLNKEKNKEIAQTPKVAVMK